GVTVADALASCANPSVLPSGPPRPQGAGDWRRSIDKDTSRGLAWLPSKRGVAYRLRFRALTVFATASVTFSRRFCAGGRACSDDSWSLRASRKRLLEHAPGVFVQDGLGVGGLVGADPFLERFQIRRVPEAAEGRLDEAIEVGPDRCGGVIAARPLDRLQMPLDHSLRLDRAVRGPHPVLAGDQPDQPTTVVNPLRVGSGQVVFMRFWHRIAHANVR